LLSFLQNARVQPLPEAGAPWGLEAVAGKRWFGSAWDVTRCCQKTPYAFRASTEKITITSATKSSTALVACELTGCEF
jgi:hypothetical protein